MLPTKFDPGAPFGVRDKQGYLVLDKKAADLLNEMLEGVRRSRNLAVAAPLLYSDGMSGPSLAIGGPKAIWATLSGGGNPYSFQEAYLVPGTGFTPLTGGSSGDNAYEANGVAGLSGKTVQLYFEPMSNDWRFQYVRTGCPPGTNLCVTVTACGGNLAGATVAISFGGVPVGMCTTDGTGACCIPITKTGAYSIVASKSGYTTSTSTVTVSTCATVHTTLNISPTTIQQVCFTVVGCNSTPLSGAAITIASGPTITTDGSGQACFTPSDTSPHSYTVSAPKYASVTGSVTGTVCPPPQSIGVTLTVDDNHVCCVGFTCPIAKTLYLSDGTGTYTLIYNSSFNYWSACVMVPTSNLASCGPTSATMQATSGNVPVSYILSCYLNGDGTTGMHLIANWVVETFSPTVTNIPPGPAHNDTCTGYLYGTSCSDIGSTMFPLTCGYYVPGNPSFGPFYRIDTNAGSGQYLPFTSIGCPLDATFSAMTVPTGYLDCQVGYTYPTPFGSSITVTE